MRNARNLLSFFISLLFCCLTSAQEGKYKVLPAITFKAIPFPLRDVQLLHGSPFKHAMDLNSKYLLQLDPDRLLHRWRRNAGLEPKGALYGGWEANSSHMLGHYLSALALHYAATGNQLFLERCNYVVDELALVQKARKTGYVGGIPEEDRIWKEVTTGNIKSSGFDLNGGWVPWYMIHKAWAGLIDAYLFTGNNKAKEIVIGMSDWAYSNFINMPDSLFQKMMMAEFGGMNESLAEVYALTGNRKYKELSYKFYDEKVMDPLSKGIDRLGGLHANTQIPKVIGAARQYELTGNKRELEICTFFFKAVLKDHTYVNGGNSNYESFNYAGKLSNALGTNTSETCNTYNMLKLARHLFQWSPSVEIGDYYERALYNHILASQHPETGMFCYYVALQSGKQKVYSAPFDSFWCCVGTGIENHAKYGEAIYFRGQDDSLFVNLYIPSQLTWAEKGISVTQKSEFPESEKSEFRIDTDEPTNLSLLFRYPRWAGNGVKVRINGKELRVKEKPGSFITIKRVWKRGDQIEIILPRELHLEAMPDNPDKVAIFYGPLLLAGALGKAPLASIDIPVLLTHNEPVQSWIRPVDKKKLLFKTVDVAKPAEVSLVPFYQLYDQKYIVYWDKFTEAAWLEKKAAYQAELKRIEEINSRIVDILRVGEQQSEKDHLLKGVNTGVGEYDNMKFRDAPNGGWFSFEMKCHSEHAQELIITYNGSDGGNRAFDILINGVKIATEQLKSEKPRQMIDKSYSIPIELTKGKSTVIVKFQAHPANIAGAVFNIRLVRKK